MPTTKSSPTLRGIDFRFLAHETVIWATASLILTLTGSYLLIAAAILRLLFSLGFSAQQVREGGAKRCKSTPYIPQIFIYFVYFLCSVFELWGILKGSAPDSEVIYRIELYALNMGFALSAGLNDTRWHRLSAHPVTFFRILLNPNIWISSITLLSASFGLAVLKDIGGKLPGSDIPLSTAIINLLVGIAMIQAIIQAVRPSPRFIWRHYSFITQIALNFTAAIVSAIYQSASWQFTLFIFLCAVGGLVYLWRNRKAPQYLTEKKAPLPTS